MSNDWKPLSFDWGGGGWTKGQKKVGGQSGPYPAKGQIFPSSARKIGQFYHFFCQKESQKNGTSANPWHKILRPGASHMDQKSGQTSDKVSSDRGVVVGHWQIGGGVSQVSKYEEEDKSISGPEDQSPGV